MGKRVAAGLVVLVILLGGGWLVLRHVAETRLRDGIAQFRASLAPNGSFTYARAESDPLHLGAAFTNASIRRNGMLLTAAHVTLGHVGRNHIGRMQLLDMHLGGNGVSGSAARLDAEDLSTSQTGPSPEWSRTRVGRLRITDIVLQPDAFPGSSARIAAITFSQGPDGRGGLSQQARLDRMRILNNGQEMLSIDGITQHSGGSPAALLSTTEATGLVIPPGSSLAAQLGQIGYQGARGQGSSTVRYAAQPGVAASGRLDIDPATLRLDGIGQLALTLKLDHLPPAAQHPDPMGEMAQARLTSLTLTYDDAGLAGHALAGIAQRSGMTASQLRTALEQSLRQRAASDGGQGFEQQGIDFLNNPRHLTITMHPPEPLPLADLAALRSPAGPADSIQTLGLRIKAD